MTALAFVVLALFAAPLAAQEVPGDPTVAPAIGPWIGASRGLITEIVPEPDGFRINAVARDPDSAQSIEYEVLVDGRTLVSNKTERPDGFGRNVTFEESVSADPGLHRVCLRLDDPRLGARTVSCTDALTEPPSQVADAVADRAKGVAIAPSGVVVPILDGTDGDWTVRTPCGATTTLRDAQVLERARVVIDPGHGGSESGAVGGGLYEKHVNLVVSERVVDKFEKLGISAALTRTADYRVPIATRAEIATSLAPDVFLSLHHNGGARRASSRPGTEIFYAEGRPESQRLAAVLYEEMSSAAAQFSANWVSTVNEGASLRLREDGMDLYGIHRFSPDIESVITEFLYLSNPSEAALMKREDVIDAEAQAIVDGIIRWWFSEDSGTSRGRQFVDSSSTGTGGFDGCTDPSLAGPPQGLSASRADVLAEVSSLLPASGSPAPLLPALELGADPALG